MAITGENTCQTHTLKTLWTETLFEMLFEAIENDWSDNATREILKELLVKGYRLDRVARKVHKRFGEDGVKRLLAKINISQ